MTLEQAEEVLPLYREKYFDLNVRHFHEKLREVHAGGSGSGSKNLMEKKRQNGQITC